jgi:SpoVK/Ycf46/Vps4 family AAA+-type ATPase
MPTRPDSERFARLLDAWHPCISIVTQEEDHALRLLGEVAIEQRHDLLVWSITQGLREGLLSHSAAVKDTEHPAAALYHLIHQRAPRRTIVAFLDLAGHLKDDRTLRLLREAIDKLGESDGHVVLIDHCDALPDVIKQRATPFDLSFPDEQELETLIKSTLRTFNEQRKLSVNMSRRGLDTIIRNLRGLTRAQARQVILDTISEDARFNEEDINAILAHKRRTLGSTSLLEYVEAPVDIDQIGGMNRLKAWLKHRQDAVSDEAEQFGIDAPRGVLMLGVQGAGKSLAAKAVATAWHRPLLRMDVGALYDRYIGESERRLREALHQAEMMAPIILWIDEIEKAFASAASQSSDGGLSKRMFGSLLTWMQERRSPVFLIATANDIEALPPELLRKGRFDEIFFVDLPTEDARRQILKIHLQKRKRNPAEFDIPALATACEGFSGAEIEQAIVSALHHAFADKKNLTTEHVLRAIQCSPPLSVTMAEKVQALRAWADGRCVPADD